MRAFTINGNRYESKPFDFNMVCDMEDLGFELEKIGERPRTAARAYFACCVNGNKYFAGKELEKHLISGGSMDELIDVMNHEMDTSDFFRYLTETEEKENTENPEEKK